MMMITATVIILRNMSRKSDQQMSEFYHLIRNIIKHNYADPRSHRWNAFVVQDNTGDCI